VIDEIETIRTMPVFETESNIWQFGLDIAGKQQHQYVVHTNKVYLQPLLRDQKRSKKTQPFYLFLIFAQIDSIFADNLDKYTQHESGHGIP
jgi:hypothetical protein